MLISLDFKNNGRKKDAAVLFVILVVVAAVGTFFVRQYVDKKRAAKNDIIIDLPTDKEFVFISDNKNDEQVANSSEQAGINRSESRQNGLQSYKSENFSMEKISIGGSDANIYEDEDAANFEITGVRSDWINPGDAKELKLLIVWKTSKLAKSRVVYSSSASDAKTLSEDGFGFTHAVVIANLEVAKRYSYKIMVDDKWGNKIESGEFSAYMSVKKDSVFDLISKEVDKMFGWALKK